MFLYLKKQKQINGFFFSNIRKKSIIFAHIIALFCCLLLSVPHFLHKLYQSGEFLQTELFCCAGKNRPEFQQVIQ